MFCKNRIILYTFILLTIVHSKDKKGPGPLVGSNAKFWSLKTQEGKFEKLNYYTAKRNAKWNSDRDRKVLVMSFFASWCQPCIKEIAELETLQEQLDGEPIQFFLINITEYFRSRYKDEKMYQDAQDATELLERKGLTKITMLNDPNGRAARAYGVDNVLPRLFVIDKYNTIKLDETGLCSSCLVDDVEPLLRTLIRE